MVPPWIAQGRLLNLAAHVTFVSRGFPGLHTTCLKLVDSHPVPVYPIDPFRVTPFISLSPDARGTCQHCTCHALLVGFHIILACPLTPCRVTQRCASFLFFLSFAGPFCNHVLNPMLVLRQISPSLGTAGYVRQAPYKPGMQVWAPWVPWWVSAVCLQIHERIFHKCKPH